MRTMHRDIVSALIFSKDNKLFLGFKDSKAGGVFPDSWHIPGGGIEKGENNVEALIREIREETGIDIAQTKIALVNDQGTGTAEKTLRDTGERVVVKMTFFVYKVTLDQNSTDVNVQINDEFSEFQWVAPAALPSLKLPPPSIALFTKLGYLK